MKSTKTSPAPTPGGLDAIPRLRRWRYRVEWLALVAARRAIRMAPLGAVRRSASILGTLAAVLDRQGAATARQNLKAAFGDVMDERERQKVVARSYRHFARTFMELFWVPRLTPELTRRWCPIEFEDEAATIEASKSGGIFITPHYGNFEWLAVAWRRHFHPLTIIAQNFKNPLITPIFAGDRSLCGNEIISQQGALLRLLKALKRGGQVALLPDLTTSPKNSAVVIEAFGLKTSVTSLPAALAMRTGCPVIPAICIPVADGTYRCLFAKPIQFPPGISMAAAAQACWDVFETFIRNDPAPWLWMYKHWRFLPKDAAAADYPPYANRSQAFDKLEMEMQN